MPTRKTKLILQTLSVLALTLVSAAAFAAEGAEGATSAKDWLAIGAGLAIGLAAFGGSLGQGRTAGAAMEGISRNPGAQGKMFVPMILGLALIESLVIYAFLIAFFLQSKI